MTPLLSFSPQKIPSNQSPNHIPQGYPLRTVGRVLVLSWSLFLLAGFGVALSLTPDPSGSGTHQQLGFPACSFKMFLPEGCPSCGMTTSFSHFVRGNVVGSVQANVGGFLLAVACLIQIPWCWVSVWKSRLWKVTQPDLLLIWFLAIFMVVSIAQWAFKLWINQL